MHSLVELVIDGAERASAPKSAVWYGHAAVTYDALLSGARGIAATLVDAGVRIGDRVGIWMEKSPSCVEAILGVLWAGAAYVPLDPRAPWRRCRRIVEDCDLAALVVDDPRLGHLPDLLQGLKPRLVLLDGARPAGASESGGTGTQFSFTFLEQAKLGHCGFDPKPGLDDLAYILYTSGSTGAPKGVVHTHRSGLAFTKWVQQTFGIVPEDVFLSHAPFHFDLSISDLYASLGSGASVRLISAAEAMLAPYLVKKTSEWGITIWYSVPSILSAMLDVGDLGKHGLDRVRVLLFAGEVFPTPQLRRLRRALPNVALFNLFGPTETNVCTYYEVPAEIPEEAIAPIPIGRVCENLEAFVLSDEGGVMGVGGEGTLWIKGDNLMQGYWNDPERTAKMLYPDPRNLPGITCRTGDRVRLRADGYYDFLGRLDHMVKTRGYRVELGEIESALIRHPSVLDAVAVPVPDVKVGNRIVATVVLRSGHDLDAKALRAFCADFLPSYMVPEQLDVRGALPRTSTGKADRQALRAHWERRLTE